MWIDPHETGVYVGQCAQYCGTQHAKMLLRVVVESRDGFRQVGRQSEAASSMNPITVAQGRHVFESNGLRQLPHRVRHECPWASSVLT